MSITVLLPVDTPEPILWVRGLGGSGNDFGSQQCLTADAAGNVYMVGGSGSVSGLGNGILLVKYDRGGNLKMQRSYYGASADRAGGIKVDSSGNIYIGGETLPSGGSNGDFLIMKLDSAGSILWSRTLGDVGGNLFDEGHSLDIDGSGNVYVAGTSRGVGTTNDEILIAKYDTNGNIQWQRAIGAGGLAPNEDHGYGIAVDASGNVFTCGKTDTGTAGSNDLLIIKHDTSGNYQWHRVFGGVGVDYAWAVDTDSSGDIYVVGEGNDGGVTLGSQDKTILAKWDTTGAFQWARAIGADPFQDRGYAIHIDSSDRVFICGETTNTGGGGGGAQDFFIAEYDTSGTIQWQRVLGTSAGDHGRGIAVGGGRLYVGGHSGLGAGVEDFMIARLPIDGSGTGTYGTVTYATSAFTEQSANPPILTEAAGSLTPNAAPGMTDQAVTMSTATESLTEFNLATVY